MNSNAELVTITKARLNGLLYKEEQVKQLNLLADKLENAEIDGFDFGEEVLNVL